MEKQQLPPILTQQIGQFYQFMFTCMMEWRQLCSIPHENTEAREALSIPDKLKNIDTSRYRAFLDYWSYRLYQEYGIKRRIHKYGDNDTLIEEKDNETEDNVVEVDKEENKKAEDLYKFYGKSSKLLVQFFYDKSLRGYDKHKPITQLCRHMVFDMASLRIVSIGVTKSFDYDFMLDNIMGAAANPEVLCPVRLEEFLEGTMVVYNPTLEAFGQQSLAKHMDAEEIEDQSKEDNFTKNTSTDNITTDTENKEVVVKNKKDLGFSTRRKLGTSYFNNPGMTFADMFKANNVESGVDMDKWPEDFKKSHCFVFNVEHNENRIINPKPNNCNTLVALYKLVDPSVSCGFPSPTSLITSFMAEDPMVFTSDQVVQQRLGVLAQGLWSYGTSTIHQIPQQNIVEYVKMALQTPDNEIVLPKCCQFLTNSTAVKADIKKLGSEFIKGQNKYQPGVMIYDMITGARCKIRNEEYSKLLDLKGNLPITVNEQNRRNLFKLFWKLRQRQDKSIQVFLKEFDNENHIYKNIFNWFTQSVHAMTNNLYLEYMAVFVEKVKHAREIPYEFKPLCGELHKAYLANRKPTTPNEVIKFVNGMPYFQVYWRLFGLHNDGVLEYPSTAQDTSAKLKQHHKLAQNKPVNNKYGNKHNKYKTRMVNKTWVGQPAQKINSHTTLPVSK